MTAFWSQAKVDFGLCLFYVEFEPLDLNWRTNRYLCSTATRWINLKVPFNEVFGGVRCNLKEAVQLAGLVWEGRAHCGLDDAKNTARLLAYLMHRGFRFTITNSLMWQSVDHPVTTVHQVSSIQQPHRAKHPPMPLFQFHPVPANPNREKCMYCYCGVKSCKQMIRKPGPKHGSFFFGCGNWTATRGALCPYFEWATSWLLWRGSIWFISEIMKPFTGKIEKKMEFERK